MFGYHFTSRTLRGGAPIPKIGEWLVHDGRAAMCESGLHAAKQPFIALRYAPGPILHRVELLDIQADDGEKCVGCRRRIVASVDLTPALDEFARRQALSVIRLWDAPPIVREYLETGDESKRKAAHESAEAASLAASGAAEAASWAAFEAAYVESASLAASLAASGAAEAASWAAFEAAYVSVESASLAASWAASGAAFEAYKAAHEAAYESAESAFNKMAIDALALGDER